jgi:RNA polymerase sigma factor (sigma-70 family)
MLLTTGYNNEKMVSAVLKGGKEADRAFRFLYQSAMPAVRQFVLNNSGNEEDAGDVFQDGLVVFHQHIKDNRFRGESSFKTYLFSICKFIWYNKLKKRKRMSIVNDAEIPDLQDDFTIRVLDEDKSILAQKLLEQVGKPCKEILIKFYFEKVPMKQIAIDFGYKNEQIARNKKFKCLNRLKELLKGNMEIKGLIENIF